MDNEFEKYLLKYGETKRYVNNYLHTLTSLKESFSKQRECVDSLPFPPWHERYIRNEIQTSFSQALGGINQLERLCQLVQQSIERLSNGDFLWEEREDHLKIIQPVFDAISESKGMFDVSYRLDTESYVKPLYKEAYEMCECYLDVLRRECYNHKIDKSITRDAMETLFSNLSKFKKRLKRKKKEKIGDVDFDRIERTTLSALYILKNSVSLYKDRVSNLCENLSQIREECKYEGGDENDSFS